MPVGTSGSQPGAQRVRRARCAKVRCARVRVDAVRPGNGTLPGTITQESVRSPRCDSLERSAGCDDGRAEGEVRGCRGHGVPSPLPLKKTPGCARPDGRRAGHLIAAAWPPHPGAGDGITGGPRRHLGLSVPGCRALASFTSASAAPDVASSTAECVPCSLDVQWARLPVESRKTPTRAFGRLNAIDTAGGRTVSSEMNTVVGLAVSNARLSRT